MFINSDCLSVFLSVWLSVRALTHINIVGSSWHWWWLLIFTTESSVLKRNHVEIMTSLQINSKEFHHIERHGGNWFAVLFSGFPTKNTLEFTHICDVRYKMITLKCGMGSIHRSFTGTLKKFSSGFFYYISFMLWYFKDFEIDKYHWGALKDT